MLIRCHTPNAPRVYSSSSNLGAVTYGYSNSAAIKYELDYLIAEIGHELVHAIVDQNNIQGVDDEYLARMNQSEIWLLLGNEEELLVITNCKRMWLHFN